MGGPVFNATVFVLLAVWVVLLALPGLRRPPPGFENKLCPACKRSNPYTETKCQECGGPLSGDPLGGGPMAGGPMGGGGGPTGGGS